MVKLLESQKNVFWEALLITIVVFFFGILIGSAYESNKVTQINEYYAQSEISLMDVFILDKLTELDDSSCTDLINSNVEFADKIYTEALLLEKYEDRQIMNNQIKLAHTKYDLLRTLLWINTIKIKEKCHTSPSFVVYLYEYDNPDITNKAKQLVWSRILSDLKQKKGNDIVLIPIAVDNDLVSLNSMIGKYNISEFPVVIVNNKNVLKDLNSTSEIERYLN